VLGGVLALLALALAFGATAVIGRFTKESPFADARFALWRDALRVFAVHPLGIGGGAFDRVYPVYRTAMTMHPVRFTHAENQPLQFLIEYGWPGSIVAAVAIAATLLSLHPRALPLSSLALAAGMLAVVVHNFVDFGMELLGDALPWFALLGTLVGLVRRSELAVATRASPASRTVALGVGGLAVLTTLMLVPTMYAPDLRDFDALIRRASTPQERRQLALAATGPHPTDYFYPLVESTSNASSRGRDGWRERLRLLNHALRLCAACADVHLEVARTLWSLARRKQAVVEYQMALRIQPDLVLTVTEEIWRNGRSPSDLIELAGDRTERTVQICTFLLDIGSASAALAVLEGEEPHALSAGYDALLRGRAALQQGKASDGETWLLKAMTSLPAEPGIGLYLAQAQEANGKLDDALRTLAAAIARSPGDCESARARLDMLSRHHRWSMIEDAIDVFKEALQNRQFPTTDAHLAAARIYLEQGRVTDSLREYQLASVQRPEDVGLLIEYARTADRAGRTTTATQLLGEASTLNPNNQDARVLLQKIADRRRETVRNASEYNQAGGQN
jgi:thioredoxin-like negative regulator of GroEL